MFLVITTPTGLGGGVQSRRESGHVVKEFANKALLDEFLRTGGGSNPTMRIFDAKEMIFSVEVNLKPKGVEYPDNGMFGR